MKNHPFPLALLGAIFVFWAMIILFTLAVKASYTKYPVTTPKVIPTYEICVNSGETTVCCPSPQKPVATKAGWSCQT